MKRRDILGGGLCLGLLPLVGARASEGRAFREFRILRGGSDIGRHRLDAEVTDDGFAISIDIEIRVSILGITAYRYELSNRERWQGGRIDRVETQANDDGDRHRTLITAGSNALEIDGTSFSGTAPSDAVTTSYYARPFIDRRPWLSTQSGRPLEIEAEADEARARTWDISGDLETHLTYDERGEWIGCEFDAGGERARYEIVDQSGRIGALWSAA